MSIAKILRTCTFKKTCKQLFLQFLLPAVNIFSWGLPSALHSTSVFSSTSSLRFKEFSLGCLVADSSLLRKKKNLLKWPLVITRYHSLPLVVTRCITRCHSLCHFLSLLVPSLSFAVTRCHLLSLDVPLVCLFINDLFLRTQAL